MYTVQLEIFARREFLPISPPALIGENIIHEFFFSCIEDYLVDMTFTTLAKILSLEKYCNTNIDGLGDVSAVQYS